MSLVCKQYILWGPAAFLLYYLCCTFCKHWTGGIFNSYYNQGKYIGEFFTHREIIYLDRKKVGGQCVFVENWTNYDHIRTCCLYSTAVEWCRAGGQGRVLASTMPRAQNRVEKGSKILQKRSTLHIYTLHFYRSILFIYGFTHENGRESSWHWRKVKFYTGLRQSRSKCIVNFQP